MKRTTTRSARAASKTKGLPKRAAKSARKGAAKSARKSAAKRTAKSSAKSPAKRTDLAPRAAAARVLLEALPHLRNYAGKSVVVKVSGRVAADDRLLADLASDLVLARQVGVRPVLVHGGAPQIAEQLAREGRASRFVSGLRVTGPEEARIVEMVLAGAVNKRIVAAIAAAGGRAQGLSGRDGGLVRARPAAARLGRVGRVEGVNLQPLLAVEQAGLLPVVAPVAGDAEGPLNINADTVAGAVAAALGAARLLVATDVEGLLDAEGRILPELTAARARKVLAASSTVGGMRPKLAACLAAVEEGVGAAVILDGRVPHALLLELFTDHGGGTLIRG